MGFISGFGLGKMVSVERVRLAREPIFLEDSKIKCYVSLRKQMDTLSYDLLEDVGKVAGYLIGTYTTFCPFQSTLNRFDDLMGIHSCSE